MQLTQSLLKAQALVKRGQLDSAIKTYRGVLRLMPLHPQANSLLGALLIHVGQNEQAARVLEVAFKCEPWNEEHWIRLLAAHHRAGNLGRAKELLVIGEGLIPKEQLKMFAYGISQPPPNRLESVMALMKKRSFVSAEISARMLIDDFPEHPFGWTVLRDLLKATGRSQEADSLENSFDFSKKRDEVSQL